MLYDNSILEFQHKLGVIQHAKFNLISLESICFTLAENLFCIKCFGNIRFYFNLLAVFCFPSNTLRLFITSRHVLQTAVIAKILKTPVTVLLLTTIAPHNQTTSSEFTFPRNFLICSQNTKLSISQHNIIGIQHKRHIHKKNIKKTRSSIDKRKIIFLFKILCTEDNDFFDRLSHKKLIIFLKKMF